LLPTVGYSQHVYIIQSIQKDDSGTAFILSDMLTLLADRIIFSGRWGLFYIQLELYLPCQELICTLLAEQIDRVIPLISFVTSRNSEQQ
jgi:hypothetical protein